MVPHVDLSESADVVASQIREASLTSGFFVATGHGVDPQLLRRVYAAAEAFFALHEEEKQTVLVNEHSRGYTPFAEETLDPDVQTCGDTKEGYYIGRDPTQQEIKDYPHPMQGFNKWPDETGFALGKWKETMLEYFEAMHQLGMRILRLVARSLGLSDTFFDHHFTRPMEALRLLKYGAHVSKPETGIFGCGAHSDYGMLTLLSTDDNPGLQIWVEGEWVSVAPHPKDFVVNIGDMLERWTNKKYRSTVHRVINETGKVRFSIPFFFEPNFDTLVECLPCVLKEGEAPLFPPITSGQYLMDKYRETHDLFAASSKL